MCRKSMKNIKKNNLLIVSIINSTLSLILTILLYLKVAFPNFMNSEAFWTMVGSVGTVAGVIVSAVSIVRANSNTKKQKTYEAFDKIKAENTEIENKLSGLNLEKINDIMCNHKEKSDTAKEPNWNDITMYLSSIERFSACANEDIYDFRLIYNMGGPYLISMYDKLYPIIAYKRKDNGRETVYLEFEKLVNRLKEERE